MSGFQTTSRRISYFLCSISFILLSSTWSMALTPTAEPFELSSSKFNLVARLAVTNALRADKRNGQTNSELVPSIQELGHENTSYSKICNDLVQSYTSRNPHITNMLHGQDAISAANFCLQADLMDGMINMEMKTKDLPGLFSLLVVQKVSPALLVYNKRSDKSWLDMRVTIEANDLENMLPESIRSLKASSKSDAAKLKKVMKFVRKSVRRVRDEVGSDIWQSPRETLKRGKGDCEDCAILFQSIAEYLGIATQLVKGQVSIKILKRSESHVWNSYQNEILDCTAPNRPADRYNASVSFNSQAVSI